MRIIRGKLKGKKIVAPKSIKARPTTDFGKESLFNILENQINIDQITALDLFAGTGNISFEFASRGAKEIVCVDQQRSSISFINDSAKNHDLPIRALKSDVFKFLKNPKPSFDIIFADPPYDHSKCHEIPKLIFNSKILHKNGLLIIEHGFENDFSYHENFIEKRTYSRVNFSFFKHH